MELEHKENGCKKYKVLAGMGLVLVDMYWYGWHRPVWVAWAGMGGMGWYGLQQ